MKAAKRRELKIYETESGFRPFENYLINLKDIAGASKIQKAVTQMANGNFGDHKSISKGNGLYERRLTVGPGYRIYYILDGDELIVLFGASDKSGQQKAIDIAHGHAFDYGRRKKQRLD